MNKEWEKIKGMLLIAALVTLLVGYVAFLGFGAISGFFALNKSWADGTLDAWLSQPVSNGLLLIVGVVFGLMLYAIARGLELIIARLDSLKDKLDDLEEKLGSSEE